MKLFRESAWVEVLAGCPPATIKRLRGMAEGLAAEAALGGRSYAAANEYVALSNTAFDWLERNTKVLGPVAVYLRMLRLESYARVHIGPLAGSDHARQRMRELKLPSAAHSRLCN